MAEVETVERVTKTICELCPISCGMEVYTVGDRIVRVDNMADHIMPELCPRGGRALDVQYHPGRLTKPLYRSNGSFKETSWDEALGMLAERLKALKAADTPEALLLHLGDAVGLRETRHIPRWFSRAYGTPNYSTGAAVCHYANVTGTELTYGHFTLPNFHGTKLIVAWGHNPRDSAPPAVHHINRFLKKGGIKLLVIDPRTTEFAKRADLHLKIRPGTDCALALAMLHVIVKEELYDKEFVEKWTVGFPQLVEHLKQYSPQAVAEVTGIPAEQIVEAARLYGSSKPATLMEVTAPEHNPNGVQTVRAIASLIAITGNFDVPGGSTYVTSLKMREPQIPDTVSGRWLMGKERYPIYCEVVKECQPMELADLVLDGADPRIKVMIVAGINPMLTWPDANRTRRAMQALDFLVVMDVFMTETAELAHLVLPACTFLERSELIDYGYFQSVALLTMSNKVVEPMGESWPDWKFWLELSKRVGLERYLPWNDLEEIISFQLEGSGYTLQQLKETPGGIFYGPRAKQRYLEHGFDTPSGKVELYCKRLEQHGYPPLPAFTPPQERPEVLRDYPLTYATGGRLLGYTHSQFHDIEKLNTISPGPFADINREDAQAQGIAHGDWVELESPNGTIRVMANVTDDIIRGVVQIPHGWPRKANANLLTNSSRSGRDPITGYPPYKWGRCRIRKVAA